ncbi:hypothetical protein, partial [Halobacillus litoralis]|uniref:hypothetical protein n=1 Tax=Halobacillus litoralis TaxID=45668 RepID=UPI001F3E6124
VKGRKFICLNFNCTTEDGNEGSMFPETIPSTLLHALRRTGLRVWSTGRLGRTKAEAIRYADGYAPRLKKLDRMRIVL